VTVGETLTEARNQAGLSVEEISERTSIRDTVIRGIEHDDYAACGGDLYVRGYVRAIAGAVGLDAQPLIREYDEGREPGESPASDQSPTDALNRLDDLRVTDALSPAANLSPAIDPSPPVAPSVAIDPSLAIASRPADDHDLDEPALTPSGRHALSYPRSDPDPAGDPDRTRFDLPPVPADPAATRFDLPPVPAADLSSAGPVTGDLMAAGYDLGPSAPPVSSAPPAWGAPSTAPPQPPAPSALPAWATSPSSPAWGAAPAAPPAWTGPPAPAGPAGPAGDPRRKRRVLVAAAVVVVLLAAGGFLGVRLASGGGTPRSTAASSPKANARPAAGAPNGSAAPASGQAEAGSTPGAAGAAVPLAVAEAAAFGPNGTADGDNPGQAERALSGKSSSSWSTQWYLTAKFGGLKSGTGLLLDLGSTASISSVKLVLNHSPGATVQLRVGSKASLPDLQTAKTASGAGGTVRLTFKTPVQAKYLLIWFTKLAPDGAGHYAETVSHIQVKGQH
jgi:transcriptional regulator with XRE-family HTH domain